MEYFKLECQRYKSQTRWDDLRARIEESNCGVICIQETKREDFDQAYLRNFSPRRFNQFAYTASVGLSRGIITIWNSNLFTGRVFLSEPFALGVELTSTQSGHRWKLINVNSPCQGEQRSTYTQWFFDLHIPSTEDWLILGALNNIRSPENSNKPGGELHDIFTFTIPFQSVTTSICCNKRSEAKARASGMQELLELSGQLRL